jgi:hypothetical protein
MNCTKCGRDIESTTPKEMQGYNKPKRKRTQCYICSPYYNKKSNKTPEEIEEMKAKSVDAVRKRRLKIKQMAVDYKGGKCEKCGYDKCIDALEFHHLNESEKEFGIGEKGHTRSWEDIKKELDKCVLLCANCHREEHSK